MFSFAKIASVAAISFGMLVAAAPALPAARGLLNPVDISSIAHNATGVVADPDLTKAVLGSDMTSVLTNLQTALAPQLAIIRRSFCLLEHALNLRVCVYRGPHR